ncbi:MAG: ATP-binding cassette domain-containing protein [Candidatus Eisenbacteria bacterium]|nr:ATP-binding cassette domain-containing protein [Candidatus Eisenbacteria bacterium]
MIEVRNIQKHFGATVALDDVTFDVARGEVLGFLGPNAAGKTTAMRIITCYIAQDAGSVTVAGHDTREESIAVRQRIGYLPESAPLYLDMGVIEYLRFIGHIRGLDDPHLNTRLAEMIEVCGLRRMSHRTIGTLSKGFRQRVGLAQTLIHDPDVLILDEPTSGLDPNQIIEIRELIKTIGQQKTVILSTHILPEVETTCSRVLIINEGRIVASGTPGELTSRGEGDARIHVTVKGTPETIEPALRRSGIATEVRLLGADAGRVRYAIASAEEEPEERLFQLAVQNDWVLTELHRESLSLEEVFTRLTTQDVTSS